MAPKKQRPPANKRRGQAVKTGYRKVRKPRPQSRPSPVKAGPPTMPKKMYKKRKTRSSPLQKIAAAIASLRVNKRQSLSLVLGCGSFSFLLGIGYGWSAKTLNSTASTIPPYPHTELLSSLNRSQTSPPSVAQTVTIKAVGDIVPGTNFPNNRLHPQKAALFQHVRPILQDADVLFGNFESTLTNYPYTSKNVSSQAVFAFRTPPEYAQLLKDIGFDVLSVANNHALDFGPQGFADTIANIEKAGMKAVGKKGQILYTQVREVKLAWIGFSYFDSFNSVNKLAESLALVEQASQNADIVILSIHAGAEGTGATAVRDRTEYFYGENRGNLVHFSRSAIDRGADLVLGHGPHVPRALELYNGKLIAYSLGNFVGYRTLSTQDQLALSLVLEVSLDGEGNFKSGQILPAYIKKPGIPYPSPQADSIKLIRYLTQRDLPNTPLAIADDGTILKK